MRTEDLCVEDVVAERHRIQSEIEDLTDRLHALAGRCSHKHMDGSDATIGVPVSAERFCRTCGAQFD